jgi:hypothetical protein
MWEIIPIGMVMYSFRIKLVEMGLHTIREVEIREHDENRGLIVNK